MKLNLKTVSLENKTPFRISHGVRTHTDTLFVKISHEGIEGIGEASHVPYYGITVKESIDLIESLSSEIEGLFGKSHEVFWRRIDALFGQNHFAKCAVDIAYYDWQAKKAAKPLYQYLGLSLDDLPESCFTIGMDKPENMAETILKSDWPSFKIKLGGENDLETLKFLKGFSEKPFKVDVNAAWELEETIALLPELVLLGLEFIEQPLAKDKILEHGILKDLSTTPIFADESCFSINDVEKCALNFDGINIKLTKCGGIYPALEMVKRARELDLKIMMGCMTESSVGISTIAHLSSLVDYVDMDGAALLKNDPADGVNIIKGVAVFNEKNGHGASLKDE
ncbi:dipeptide epimerase [Arcticibacterium luteifluviistationis]|uniref:Dipeptide epimerase n=1 Tax=Arcticibacterium luteifluviistationis TaxID=1784714 RepID=A0A2Z4GEQ3_9BACT|nr:dipeptide epimerase [Arcticibacterium luteifluviistationis]AWV99819.1 dipeptide epimerase [Arcticibacterium luteifluviistationis]